MSENIQVSGLSSDVNNINCTLFNRPSWP